jgi:hypothetical protein
MSVRALPDAEALPHFARAADASRVVADDRIDRYWHGGDGLQND